MDLDVAVSTRVSRAVPPTAPTSPSTATTKSRDDAPPEISPEMPPEIWVSELGGVGGDAQGRWTVHLERDGEETAVLRPAHGEPQARGL
jgi:hypothetical protein